MNARSLARLHEYLKKTAQTQTVILPQVTVSTGKKKKKRELSPEAVKTIKELQRLPRDVFSGSRGVGSAIQSAALGGAIGTGLAFPVAGLTAGGFKAGPVVRKAGTGQVGRLERFFGGGRETELARRAIRSGAVRNLAIAGAGTGLATNLYYQAKRKKLETQLKQQLDDSNKKKKKKKGSIVKTAQLSGDEKMPEEKFNETLSAAEAEWAEALIKEARGVTVLEREAEPVPEPTEIEEKIREEVGPEKLAREMRKEGKLGGREIAGGMMIGGGLAATGLGATALRAAHEQKKISKGEKTNPWASKFLRVKSLPPEIQKKSPKEQAAWYKKHHMKKTAAKLKVTNPNWPPKAGIRMDKSIKSQKDLDKATAAHNAMLAKDPKVKSGMEAIRKKYPQYAHLIKEPSHTKTAAWRHVGGTASQEKSKILATQQRMKAQKKTGSVVERGIASMLDKAAAVLTEEKREELPKKDFAVPKGEKYPIPDLAHARNALARVSQHGTPEEREQVRKKVYAKYPELKEGFKKDHGGESPTSKENVKKEEQGNIGKEGMYEIGGIKVARDMPPFLKQDRPEKVKDIYKAIKRDHPEMPAEMKARIAARQGKPGKQKQGPPYKGPIKEGALRPDHWADRSAVRAFNHYAEFMNDAIRAKEKETKGHYGITAAQRDEITRQYNKLTGKKIPMAKDYKGLQSFITMAKKQHEDDEMRWAAESPPKAKKEERIHHMMTIKTGAEEHLQLAADMGLVKEAQGEGPLTATMGEKGEALGAAAGLVTGVALGAAVKGSGDRVISGALGGLLGSIVGAAGGRMAGGTAELLTRKTEPGPYERKRKQGSYEIGGLKIAAGEAAAVEELGLTSAAGESVQADQEGVKKDFVDKKDTATTKDLQQVVHPPQTTDALFKEKDGALQMGFQEELQKIAQGQGYGGLHPQMAAGGRRGPQVVYVMVPYKKPSAGKRTKEFVKKHRAALPILGTAAGAGGGALLGEHLNIPGGALSGAGLGGLAGALGGHYAEKRLAKNSAYEIGGEKIAKERKPGEVSKKDVKQVYEKSVRTGSSPVRRAFIWDVGDVVGRKKGREEYKPSTMIALPMRKAAQQRPVNPMMGGGDVRYTVGPSPEDVAEYLRTQELSRQIGALTGAGVGAAGGGALGYYGGGALAQGLGLGEGGEAASRIAGTLLGGGLGGVVGGRAGAPAGEAIGGLVAEQTTPAAQIETPFLSPERSEAIARRLAVAPMLRGGRTPTVAVGPG